jgi:hypothetical protein
MSEMEEDWALLRRDTPKAEVVQPVEDMSDDWRALQGYNDFGYMVSGSDFGYLAIWKVRILGPAGVLPGYGGKKKAIKFEHVELIWHQEKARTEATHTVKSTGRVIRVFRTAEDSIGSLQDACCKLQVLRDKARSSNLQHRTRLHEQIREMQEEIERTTKRIAELDSFAPFAVVPGDILEAELQEEDRILSEMRAEG